MNYGNYPDLNNIKKILVVKMRHHGDVLLTSPVFSALKEKFPDAEIDAYVYLDTLPMLEGHPSISRFFLYNRGWKKLSILKRLRHELGILKAIFFRKYDLVVNLTEGDRGAIVALFSRARIKVGFASGGKGFWKKDDIFTHVVKHVQTPRHTVEKQLDVLRKIGIFPSEKKDLHLHIPDSALANMKSLLSSHSIQQGGYILIHPVSRWRFKCWPLDKVTKLIEVLSQKGYKIVLTSGPDEVEKQMNDQVLASIPHIPVCNLSGKTSLKELAALIQMAKGIVCVDSVPLHMASATKTPLVAIFGPTSERNWGPWQHPKACVIARNFSCRPCFMDGCGGSKRSECLTTLPVEAVLRGIQEVGL